MFKEFTTLESAQAELKRRGLFKSWYAYCKDNYVSDEDANDPFNISLYLDIDDIIYDEDKLFPNS